MALKKSPSMIQNGIYLNVLGVISADSKPDLAAELAEELAAEFGKHDPCLCYSHRLPKPRHDRLLMTHPLTF